MKKNKLKTSLQTKILVMVIALVLTVITTMLFIYIMNDYRETIKNKKDLSLQTAKTMSYMDYVQKSFSFDAPSSRLQPLSEQIQSQVKASYIIIINKEGEILSHPDINQIGTKKEIIEEYKAIVFGAYYSNEASEIIGPSVVGISPIIDDKSNTIVGAVIVGYLNEVIYSDVFDRTRKMLIFSSIILLLSIIFSVILAKSIRNDTFGMEPFEIATLYRDRETIFYSMEEGLLVIDSFDRITLVNKSAGKLLNIFEKDKMRNIRTVIPELNMINWRNNQKTHEVIIRDIPMLLNIVPLKNSQKGYLFTFIDKSEIKQLTTALEKVQEYSDDLRAQTHEFSNKLHVISGLIQLKQYDKVIKMIQNEITINNNSNRLIFEQIKDSNIQAILLGKIGKASEMKLNFIIDENSSLEKVPEHIQTSQLAIIIGNLLDNAFEASMNSKKKEVTFFAIDIGNDIIFEISNTGPILSEKIKKKIFTLGFSTKEDKDRGFGLQNVEYSLNELNGFIEIQSNELNTTFIVYIPKKKGDYYD